LGQYLLMSGRFPRESPDISWYWPDPRTFPAVMTHTKAKELESRN